VEGFKEEGVLMVYVKTMEDMYNEAEIIVKNVCGETKEFTEKVGVHQESALSSYFFSLVMERVYKRNSG